MTTKKAAKKKTTKKAAKKKTTKKAAKKTTKKAAKKTTKKAAKKPPVVSAPLQGVPASAELGPQPAPLPAGREWLVFSDLHYSHKTKDRSLATLAHIREQAAARKVDRVIFTGDFWHQRGALPVRLLTPLLEEFQRWQEAGVRATLIPGNHDQVTRDGKVHSLTKLEPCPNIEIATEPLIEGKVAFLPWREEPEEQAALFTDLEGEGWTIFAHAEIGGAYTNHGYTSPGRVSLATIESKAFACYLGHYHLRQKHGKSTYYLGNPFELDYREVSDPKGYAIITEGVVEPEFFEIPGMPKHHVWQVPSDWDGEPPPEALLAATPQDFVRVHATRDQFSDERLATLLRDYPQVERIASKAEQSEEPPEFALSLQEAIDKALLAVPEGDRAAYREVGAGILSEIPQPPRPSATQVTLLDVQVSDFASISGTISVSLEKGTFALITGKIGSGKTSIIDAITWALFGQTSPRKAGSDSAVMRGDEVINDKASKCQVSVSLHTSYGYFAVIRSKKRGSGAKVEVVDVEGCELEVPNGIADTTEWIRVLVGYDYALWRASVSLGQGAVGNFVTSADKARKELLLDSLGLSVCKPARAQAKKLQKALAGEKDQAKMRETSARAKLEALAEYDFAEMSAVWEQERAARVTASHALSVEHYNRAAACDVQLQTLPQWEAADTQLRERKAALSTSREPAAQGLRTAELDHAPAASRYATACSELDQAKSALAKLLKREHPPCPTCGTPMGEATAASVREKASELVALRQATVTTEQSKMERSAAALAAAQEALRVVESQVATERAALEEHEAAIAKAMQTFAEIQAKRTIALQSQAQSTSLMKSQQAEKNPHTQQAEDHARRKDALVSELAQATEALGTLEQKAETLEFWANAFGPKGIPVLALRPVMHSLQESANRYLAQLVGDRLSTQLSMTDDSLLLQIFERCPDGEVRERRYEQFSGGMRRCIELAFSPFALGDFARLHLGRRIDYIAVDELTAGLGSAEKARAVEMLRSLGIGCVLVVDHDPEIQGAFDETYQLTRSTSGASLLSRI